MKKVFMALFAIALSCSAMAQDSTMTHAKMHQMQKMHDGVMMKDGKMMVMKDGKMMMMDKTMTMKNGTMVMPDGRVKMKNGKSMKMTEGACMDMEGDMMKSNMKMKEHGKMHKDSTMKM